MSKLPLTLEQQKALDLCLILKNPRTVKEATKELIDEYGQDRAFELIYTLLIRYI